jgi:hypothetical protein
MFGDHPGYVDLTIRVSVYNPLSRREEKLPGKELSLLVSSVEEVDEMLRVIEATLRNWIAGIR